MEWQRADIQNISDICHKNNGNFLSHTELTEKYNVSCSFLDLLKIRLSIPLHWRRLLTGDPTNVNPPLTDFEIKAPGQELAEASSIGARAMYNLIIESKLTISTACQRWQEDKEEISLENQEEWNESCNGSYRANIEKVSH